MSIQEAIVQLAPLSPEEWADFAGCLEPKTYKKGDFLIREGQVERYVYFLDKGATRSFFLRDGKEFTVDFLFAGDFVTAYYSFITREPSTVSIEFLEDGETTAVSYEALQTFYAKYHTGEKIGRLIAEYQYVRRLRKEMELLSLTAETRYMQLLSRHPELVQQLSVKHLSSYLGIAPESLSRIRKMRN
jgi:CRP/FNR family transcriptional regulator, anaerobic regulatory protein